MISYRNPDASMSHYTMDDYLRPGISGCARRGARDHRRAAGQRRALCLGGTLALIALSVLAATGQGDRVNEATVTNTLIDFSIPGDLGVFTDEGTIDRLEKPDARRGISRFVRDGQDVRLDARATISSGATSSTAGSRASVRRRSTFWRGTATRRACRSRCIRSICARATCTMQSCVRTRSSIDDTPIDLGKIKTPLYVLGAENDHIAPWHATYLTTQHVGGPAKYTLTNAGHIAGIVNPPGGKKSTVLRQAAKQCAARSADEWLARARIVTTRRAGGKIGRFGPAENAAADVAPYALPEGEAAPGKYVRNEVGEPFGVAKAARS